MEDFFSMVDFFLTMEDFFSYHGGYSEPEAVLAIERMAREASQSDMRHGISGANSPSFLFLFHGEDMS